MNSEKQLTLLLLSIATAAAPGCGHFMSPTRHPDFHRGSFQDKVYFSGEGSASRWNSEAGVRATLPVLDNLAAKVEAATAEGERNLGEDSQYLKKVDQGSASFFFVTEQGDVIYAVGPKVEHTAQSRKGGSSIERKNRTDVTLEGVAQGEVLKNKYTQLRAELGTVLQDDIKYSQKRRGKLQDPGAVAQINLLQQLGYNLYLNVGGDLKYLDESIESTKTDLELARKHKWTGGMEAGIYFIGKKKNGALQGMFFGPKVAYEFSQNETRNLSTGRDSGNFAYEWTFSLPVGYDLGQVFWPNRKNRPSIIASLEPYARYNHMNGKTEWGGQLSISFRGILETVFGSGKKKDRSYLRD